MELSHVVSHRHQVFMILNKSHGELNLMLNVRVDNFDYVCMYVCMRIFFFFLSHESNVSGGVGILFQIYFVAAQTRSQIPCLTQGCNLCLGILNAMYDIHMRT